MLRAVGVIRLSKRNDASESPQVQRHDIEAKAAALGAELVDVVVDLAVSAFKIPPMDRPKLGPSMTLAATPTRAGRRNTATA